MRHISLILAITGCAGLAAACAHAQSDIGVDTAVAPLCQLTLSEGPNGRELIAHTAPGLSGRWTLEAGGPAMMMHQSGLLSGRAEGASELARLQVASAAGRAPDLDALRPGQTVMSGSADEPLFASLRLEAEDGRPICAAELG
jgi:hypothetical protein